MADVLSPAVFIDRDGTIMRDADYCSDPQQVKIFPGISESLTHLKSQGFKIIVISNQSGIGRGLFTIEQYRAVEAELLRRLGSDLIDATYICPHSPDEGCNCRKPASGMILQATREHGIDISNSFLIGDKEIDVECAHNAGVPAIRVKTGPQRDTTDSKADWIVDDLPAAAAIILKTENMTARSSRVASEMPRISSPIRRAQL